MGGVRYAALAVPLVLSAAGCGGGGGGGGNGGGPSTVTISGTVVTSNGTPVASWAVGFDEDQTFNYVATTNAQGQYVITVPTDAVTGHDTLAVTDPFENPWYDGAVTVSQNGATVNIALPPFDTVTGTILQNNGSPAQNYEVRYVTADTSVNTGLYWATNTDEKGDYTLNVPVGLYEGSSTIPVITGDDNLYINSYPTSTTIEEWEALTAKFDTAGGSTYTLNETLPATPISDSAATGHAYLKRHAAASHGVALEPANRSLPIADAVKTR